ncbi:selenocysteine insertion sequence-binding protein 2-like [Nasonia vitripennis]|uniref:Ribosomal protein eL8/eL30/eS12/Gadd45 domain-containing protein n=1 Tax=Nasonia vitripennis TaxID=7425 RepID=A0A7M7LKR4_NASVI|nr:selenocysteine insertion sequence-binding protein 2-like [Nasonia vitripennis]
MEEGQHEAQHAEAPKSWRETSDEKTSSKQWTPIEVLRHRLYDKVQVKPPARDMKLKMAMHRDLLRHFSRNKDRDAKDHIKDRFNFVQKPRGKVICAKKNVSNAGLIFKREYENHIMDAKISDLVTKIDSPKFKVAEDPKIDFNIARAVSTMSCYDNVHREPPVEMGDGTVLDSRPDVTKKLENVSIHDPYHINDAVPQKTLCMSLIDQTVSLDISANAQNQPGSQLPVVHSGLVDFSRGFREYCTNTINPQLNEALEKFIAELSRLQRNLYNRDNAKGRYRRRFYAGFREIEKRLKLNKVKLALVAPNLDKSKDDDGELDKMVHRFIDSCRRHEVPVVFGLSRRKLGYLTHGKGFVSCIGVANYEALEDKLEEALKNVVEARNEFRILSGQADKTIDMTELLTDDLLLSERVKLLLKTLASH